jgi:hypothetical protein
MLAVAHSANAFWLPFVGPVTEFFNVETGHYFMTADLDEAAGLEAGRAGPGWVRTGLTFSEVLMTSHGCFGLCLPVSRFYAPSANTHFFTLDTAEAETLLRPGSGWTFEGYAFMATPPDLSGGCEIGTTPVYRLYNNRAAFHDVNHRFVTSADERARMLSKGWIDEGVRFCADAVNETPLKSFAFDVDLRNSKIQPSSACEDETRNLGPCMAVNNLPSPTTHITTGHPFAGPQVFGNVTGMVAFDTFTEGPLPDAVAATTAFVQQSDHDFFTFGVHVDTTQRGPALLTSVNPLFQFKTTVDPGTADTRVFPFTHAYESDAQISVKFIANVRTVNVRNSASQAYGHPTLEFIDQRSGHHVYFIVLVFATVPISDGNYLSIDTATGKVIVGTNFRDVSPYVRNFGSWTFTTPPGFVPENSWGKGGPFEYRMDRTEFARVLASARTLDPALSAAPEDYLLDNYHFNNEVAGDGEIGMNLGGFRLEIVRR